MKTGRQQFWHLRPSEFWSKGTPLFKIFFFSVIAIIIGLSFHSLKLLVYLGAVIIAAYIIYFSLWLK